MVGRWRKERFGFRAVLVPLGILALLGAPSAQAVLPVLQNASGIPSLSPVLREITPAVVNISVLSEARGSGNALLADPFFRHFFNLPKQRQARPKRSAGSGVVVNAREGYILTNHHVIEDGDQILVTLKDQRSFAATLVGSDPETDIAVLQIDADELKQVPIGDSDQLEVGDFVVAIGNPFGLGQTVTSGIVSALGRSGLNIEGYEDFIQTDASINPGNSGGPLVTLRGELVGINAAIIGPSGGNVGIGFAVPSNMAKAVMEQILAHGKMSRGRLGVVVQDLTPDIAEALGVDVERGAVVSAVEAGSTAQQAGLRAGDVVVEINQHRVRSSADLRNQVGLVPVGSKLQLVVVREGKRIQLAANVAQTQLSSIEGAEVLPALSGAQLGDIERGHPLFGRLDGVFVSGVDQGSSAWRVGLRAGDLILAVNRRSISSIRELAAAIAEVRRVVALDVQRGETRLLLVLQ